MVEYVDDDSSSSSFSFEGLSPDEYLHDTHEGPNGGGGGVGAGGGGGVPGRGLRGSIMMLANRGPQLSMRSLAFDREGKGYLNEIEQAVRNYDKNGDGEFDIDEVFEIVENLEQKRKEKYCLKKSLYSALFFTLILLGGVAGLLQMVLNLTKEMEPDPDANLVDHDTGNMLATHSRGVKLAVDIDLSAAFSERNRDRDLETTNTNKLQHCVGPISYGSIPKADFESQWSNIVDGSQTHFQFANGNTEITVLVDGHNLHKTTLQDGKIVRYTGLKDDGATVVTSHNSNNNNNHHAPTQYYHVYCYEEDKTDNAKCDIYKTNAPTIVVSVLKKQGATFTFRTDFPTSSTQILLSKDPYFVDETTMILSNIGETTIDNDCTGYVTIDNGLQSDTQYYYKLLLDGVEMIQPDYVQTFRTYPKQSSDTSYAVLVFADATNANDHNSIPTYRNAGKEDALFSIQIGDFDHSEPKELDDFRLMHRNLRNPNFEQGNQFVKYILSKMSFWHIFNDNDYCASGSGSGSGSDCNTDAAQQAFNEYYPNYPYGSKQSNVDGQYYYFTAGDAEFIVLDTRSQRSSETEADNDAKTMLGTKQLQWLQNRLLSSPSKWKFIISSVTANTGSTTTNNNNNNNNNSNEEPLDHWGSYQTEASIIRNFIYQFGTSQSSNGSIIMITGDLHTGGGIDNGCNNYFGIPEINIAPTNFRSKRITNPSILGDWTNGVDNSGNPGYGVIIIDTDQIILTNKNEYGHEIQRLVIDLDNFTTNCNNSQLLTTTTTTTTTTNTNTNTASIRGAN